MKAKINPVIAAGRHTKKRGSKRMKEFGYKRVEIFLDAAEAQTVIDAAEKVGAKIATFVRMMAVSAACETLGLELAAFYARKKANNL